MGDVTLGRVNWVASVSPLFLDICSTRPEVATHGEVVYSELRKYRTMFSPTYTVRLSAGTNNSNGCRRVVLSHLLVECRPS